MAESSLSEIHTEVTGTENSSVTNGVRGRTIVVPELDKPLPVVELKPFTRQVWRREKSYPEFYDKPRTANGESSSERWLQFDIEGSDTDGSKEGDIAARVVAKYLERQRVYTSECRLADMNGPRYRIKIHPSIDFSYNCRPQKMNGVLPEFIPRAERTKTTFQDATRDDNENRQYSLAKQAMSDDTIARQQKMKIHGGRITHTSGNQRTNLSYLNPLATYGQTDSWKNSNHRTSDIHVISSLSSLRKPNINGNCSDSYHKSSTASSEASSISGHVSRPRARVPMKYVHQNRHNKPVSNKHHVSVNIGGIRNALQVLSDSGPPTKLERQLTFEMEVNMEKCRRHLELPPPDSIPQFPQTFNPNMFYDVNRSIKLTKGEVMLKQGRDLNKQRMQTRRHSRGKLIPPVDFNRNVRHVEAVQMASSLPSPHTDTLAEAFYNGLFDRMSDSSPRSITYPNHNSHFSRGNPLNGIVSKGNNSNQTPTSDTTTLVAESIPRDLAASDIRLDEVKDADPMSPRATSYTAGNTPRFDTYITEPPIHPGDHVMYLDSPVMRDRKSMETQTVQFSKAHFMPCSTAKLKDDVISSENDGIRAVT